MALEIPSLVPKESKLPFENSLGIIKNAVENNKIKLGKCRHYKGKDYEVIGLARHSETLEKLAVYFDYKRDLWVRPLKMFIENIEIEGKKVPRFKYIGK